MGLAETKEEIEDHALTQSEWTYDQKFKQLFQNKKFLVPILKNVVKEYKDLELNDIEELIISIKGMEEVAANIGIEDVGKENEMKTYYDVLAGCRLPGTEELIMVDLYFDLDYSDFRFIPINLFKGCIFKPLEQIYRNNSFSILA